MIYLPLSKMLQDLIVSRVRVKILSLFLLNPGEMYYVRQIVRAVSEEINAVRRELAHLEKRGLLRSETRGNRLYYKVRQDYPLYFDLLQIINKETGLGGAIMKKRRRLGKVVFAMLSGKFIRHLERKKNEVDLLIIGDIVAAELDKLVRDAEKKLEREINYTVMSEKEFTFRKRRNDPFVRSILGGSRIMVIGDEEGLVA